MLDEPKNNKKRGNDFENSYNFVASRMYCRSTGRMRSLGKIHFFSQNRAHPSYFGKGKIEDEAKGKVKKLKEKNKSCSLCGKKNPAGALDVILSVGVNTFHPSFGTLYAT